MTRALSSQCSQNEPAFVTKLSTLLARAKKSKNEFDKEWVMYSIFLFSFSGALVVMNVLLFIWFSFLYSLAALGIIRISSRTSLNEPSSMRSQIKKILSDDELRELKDIQALPSLEKVKFLEGVSYYDYYIIIRSLYIYTYICRKVPWNLINGNVQLITGNVGRSPIADWRVADGDKDW